MRLKSYHLKFIFLYVLLLTIYILGMLMPLMELDSAQHATMAMRMVIENDYLNLIKAHQPYLDKPHFHFWLAAFSFKLFGISAFTYRLPAVLFLWGGAWGIFQLARLLYKNDKVAHFSTLIFLSSQTIILSAHDVRTDAVLTGATIISIWKVIEFLNKSKLSAIILAAVFAGIAFSTKGLVAWVVIALSVFSYLIYTRTWSSLLSYKIIIGVFFLLISVSPTLYAYYQQFDKHPELIVDGNSNISGVRFILWEQVFNRLHAKGFSQTSPDYLFFFHSLLWVFLPFSLLGYFAIIGRSAAFIKFRFQKNQRCEFLTLGATLSLLILFSFSKFKLPHYLNILIPILSILTGSYLVSVSQKGRLRLLKKMLIVQYTVVIATVLVGFLLGFYVFRIPSLWLIGFCVVLLLILLYFMLRKEKDLALKIVMISVLASVWANFNLNTSFYPKLLEYQGGKQLAAIVKERGIACENIFLLKGDYNWSFDFYTQQNTAHISVGKLENRSQDTWIVTDEIGLDFLIKKELYPKEKTAVKHFHVTRLKKGFLNPKTRGENLSKKYLLKY